MKQSIMIVLVGLSLYTYTSKAMEEATPENSIDLSANQLPSDLGQLKNAVLLSRQIQQSLTNENKELSQGNEKLQEELKKLKQGNQTLITHLRKLVQQTTQHNQYTTTLETENKDLQAAIKYLQMLTFNTDMLQEQHNMAESLNQLVAIQSEQLEFAQRKWTEKLLFMRASFALSLLNSGYKEGLFGPDESIKQFVDKQVDALCNYIKEYKPKTKQPSTPPMEIIKPRKNIIPIPNVPHNTPEYQKAYEEYDDDLYSDTSFDPNQELLLENLDNVV